MTAHRQGKHTPNKQTDEYCELIKTEGSNRHPLYLSPRAHIYTYTYIHKDTAKMTDLTPRTAVFLSFIIEI